MGLAEKLIGRGRAVKDHGDDLDDRWFVAMIARLCTTELHCALLSWGMCSYPENGGSREILRRDRGVVLLCTYGHEYGRWLGFCHEHRRFPDGTVFVRDAEGTDLAFQPGSAPEHIENSSHFGFRRRTAVEVRDLHAALVAHGVPVAEFEDDPQLVTVKIVDSDGYLVEVYWER